MTNKEAVKWLKQIKDKYVGGGDETFDECRKEAIEKAIEALTETGRDWIPASERLPEYPCVVCDAHGNRPTIPLEILKTTDEVHGEWCIDGRFFGDMFAVLYEERSDLFNYGNRIIAWMPLPEPYKEGK